LGDEFMQIIKSFIGEILLFLIVLCIVCIAGLVDIRAEQYPKQEENIKAMNVLLEGDKAYINDMGKNVAMESREVDEAKSQMEGLKNSNKIDEWNNSVISYNTKLFKYKKDINEYYAKLDEYNKKYNALSLTVNKNENVLDWLKSILGN
jgi:uncharacterized coiled-coil DUF342 family protein